MKAVVLSRKYKMKYSLTYQDVSDPGVLGSHDVLVELKYVGVNYADILAKNGMYNWRPDFPYVIGFEGSGIVREIGSHVTKHNVGDHVLVASKYGCYSTHVVALESQIFPGVPSFSMQENASFFTSFMTAYLAITKIARAKEGDSIFIHSIAGSLGLAALQISNVLKLRVAGISSSDIKLQTVNGLYDTDLLINYHTQDFVDPVKRWTNQLGTDIILGSLGGDIFKQSRQVLAPFGLYIFVGVSNLDMRGFGLLPLLRARKRIPKVKAMSLLRRTNGVAGLHLGWLLETYPSFLHELYSELVEFTTQHEIRPIIDRVYDLTKFEEAHDFIEARQNVGKVLLATSVI